MLRGLALLCALCVFSPSGFSQEVGKIEQAMNSGVVIRGGETSEAKPGASLNLNDVIRTNDDGRLRISLKDGVSLTLGRKSEMRIVTHDTEKQQSLIELLHGQLRAQSDPTDKQGRKLYVRTPTAMILAFGTGMQIQTLGPNAQGISGAPANQPTAGPSTSGQATPSANPQPGAIELVVQNNGQAVTGAEVALSLANQGKVPVGTTDSEGNTSIALDLANLGKAGVQSETGKDVALELANLGKAEMHVEVEECPDGKTRVWLVGPDGQLGPPGENCKRRRLAGFFLWGHSQRVVIDVGLGTVVATDTGPAAAQPPTTTQEITSLSQLTPGAVPGEAQGPTLADYVAVEATLVIGLDHFTGAANINGTVKGVTYLLPGQYTVIERGNAPTAAAAVWDERQQFTVLFSVLIRTYGIDLGELDEFGTRAVACESWFVVNGVAFATARPGSAGAPPRFRYKITGLGTSTGNALQLQVWNESSCSLHFLVTDGAVLNPKGFTERLIAGLILGNPPLKDFQKMITMGAMLSLSSPAGAAAAGITTTVPPGGTATTPLRSYCLELRKLAPHPKTEYKFADADEQQKLGTNRSIVDKTFHLRQTGQLPLAHQTLDGVIQWSLWTRLEGMDEKKFREEYFKLVRKNYDAQKKKWDKDAERLIETSAQELWGHVRTVLGAL